MDLCTKNNIWRPCVNSILPRVGQPWNVHKRKSLVLRGAIVESAITNCLTHPLTPPPAPSPRPSTTLAYSKPLHLCATWCKKTLSPAPPKPPSPRTLRPLLTGCTKDLQFPRPDWAAQVVPPPPPPPPHVRENFAPPLTGYSTCTIYSINGSISFHSCQILSPSETGL